MKTFRLVAPFSVFPDLEPKSEISRFTLVCKRERERESERERVIAECKRRENILIIQTFAIIEESDLIYLMYLIHRSIQDSYLQ